MLILLSVALFAQSCNTSARFPIDKSLPENLDDRIIGKWKFKEDTNQNNFYQVMRKAPYNMEAYHIKFWNRGGTNPTYEANLYLSVINGVRFVNMPDMHHGYFFLKILEDDLDHARLVTSTVKDSEMGEMNSSEEVRKRIEAHLNDPGFYSDTVHLFKVE